MAQLGMEWNKRNSPTYTIFLSIDNSSKLIAEKFRDRLIAADKKKIIIEDLLRIPLIDITGNLSSKEFEFLKKYVEALAQQYGSLNFQFTNFFEFINKNIIVHLNMNTNMSVFDELQTDLQNFPWSDQVKVTTFSPQINLYLAYTHRNVLEKQLTKIINEINTVEIHQTHSISMAQFSQYNGVARTLNTYPLSSANNSAPNNYDGNEKKENPAILKLSSL